MDDRELLELAAKAAGAKWTDYSDRTPDHLVIQHADGAWWPWRPLEDDGDAFRLAIKLDLFSDTGMTFGFMEASTAEDPLSATRREIVAAAAWRGKAMEVTSA